MQCNRSQTGSFGTLWPVSECEILGENDDAASAEKSGFFRIRFLRNTEYLWGKPTGAQENVQDLSAIIADYGVCVHRRSLLDFDDRIDGTSNFLEAETTNRSPFGETCQLVRLVGIDSRPRKTSMAAEGLTREEMSPGEIGSACQYEE
jgi:hypothetical protein